MSILWWMRFWVPYFLRNSAGGLLGSGKSLSVFWASPSFGQTSDIEAKLEKNTEGATKKLIGDFEAINTMTYVWNFETSPSCHQLGSQLLPSRSLREESFELVDVLEKKLERMGLRATWAQLVMGLYLMWLAIWWTNDLEKWWHTMGSRGTEKRSIPAGVMGQNPPWNIHDYKVISYNPWVIILVGLFQSEDMVAILRAIGRAIGKMRL